MHAAPREGHARLRLPFGQGRGKQKLHPGSHPRSGASSGSTNNVLPVPWQEAATEASGSWACSYQTDTARGWGAPPELTQRAEPRPPKHARLSPARAWRTTGPSGPPSPASCPFCACVCVGGWVRVWTQPRTKAPLCALAGGPHLHKSLAGPGSRARRPGKRRSRGS